MYDLTQRIRIMKITLAVLLFCLTLQGCLTMAVMGGVTGAAVGVVVSPIKIGGAIIDVVTQDDENEDEED
jgi:hypothetical protein